MMPDATLAGWIAGMLVHATWIASLVALAAWAILRSTGNARTAHATAAGALLLIGASLVAVGVLTWPETPATAIAAPASWTGGTGPTSSMPEAPAGSALIPSEPARTDWRVWLSLAWSCGVLVMCLRQAVDWWLAIRLRRSALVVTGVIAERFAVLCRAAGYRVPLLLASARLAVPVAMGWWRPVVLVPTGLLAGLPASQLEALFLHELAHLRRHDWLVESAIALVGVLLYFHPAIWWLVRQLRQAREQCCDGQAVRAGADPAALARALLALAEHAVPRTAALAATGGALAERVRRLLGLPGPRATPWSALATITLLPLLATLVSACTVAERPQPRVTSVVRPAEPPSVTEPGGDGFPLPRRLRARAEWRNVHVEVRMVEAGKGFWNDHGIGGQPGLLDREATTRLLAALAADDQGVILEAPTITTFPLQRAHSVFMQQLAYVGDYELVDGVPSPIVSVVNSGVSFEVCAEPVEGSILMIDVRYTHVELVGTEQRRFTFPWPGGGARDYPLESPVILIEQGAVPRDTRVEIGKSVLLPLSCRVQRGSPTFPQAREGGTILEPVPEPDLTTRPRRFCLITAEAVPAEVGPFGRLTTTPDAAPWLDGTTVTMHLRDVPLDDAVRALTALLPVPVEVVRDADYEATRVTVIAHAEPVRSVLARLLHQCLLDGTASGTLLRLVPAAQADYPAPRIGLPATTQRSVEGGT